MSEIFREIDEDIRRDRLIKLWRAYGPYAFAVAIAVVLGVAGSVGWREYSLHQRQADGARFAEALKALNRGDSELAAQRFALLAEDAGTGYAMLAQLREADALIAADDADGAIAVLDRLAEDDGADPALRDLARLLAVLHLIDRADPGELDRRLEPLVGDDSVWRASALELSGLAAMRAGETNRAKEIFAGLSRDGTAPLGVRDRAAELLASLGGG